MTVERYRDGLRWTVTTVLIVLVWAAAGLQLGSWRLDVGEHRAAAFLQDFRGVERSADGSFSYQWSRAESQIRLPRALAGEQRLLTLRIVQRGEAPPRAVTISGGGLTAALPQLPASSRVYRLLVSDAGDLRLESDLRGIADAELAQLGVMVDWLQLTPVTAGTRPTLTLWAAAAAIALTAAVSSRLLGLTARDQLLVAGGLVLFCAYLGFSSLPELLVALEALPWLVLVLSTAVLLLRRGLQPLLGAAADATAGSILLWLFAAGAGISYPGYIPTDINFHLNRLQLTLGGNFFLTAEGQGQTYPYPAGVYLLLAPLSALSGGTRWSLQWLGLAAGAMQIVLLSWYLLRQGLPLRTVQLSGLLGAILPAGFLLNAQAPLAQNFGGLLSTAFVLVLSDSLAQAEQHGAAAVSRRRRWALTGLGFAVAVGHFGVLLNTALLSLLVVLGAPRAVWAQRRIAASWPAALALAGLLVYSVYLPGMLEQLGRLTAEETPPSRLFLLTRFILDIALYGHYRVLYVGLALGGWWLLWRQRERLAPGARWLLRWSGAMLLTSALLMAAVVAVSFNATRYAIFMWPAICGLAAIALQQFDRPGWRRALIGLLLAATLVSTLLQWFSVFALQARNGFLS
jgi:hypothetical protein